MQDFLKLLEKSPTYYHAKKEISYFFAENDFSPLDIKEKWILEKNQGYFLSFGSFLIAFKMPETLNKMAIIASHLDSPGLKLKPNSSITNGHSKLATAPYGSPIYSTWMNRMLGISGKVIYTDKNNKLKSSLVNLNEHPIMIAQPAIHLNKTVNEEGVNPLHLTPLISLNENIGIEDLLKKSLSYKTLIDFDLHLYPLEKPALIGLENDLIAGYRLDNLCSSYSCMKAIAESKNKDTLLISLFYNHEEIGSKTAQGAYSPLVEQILQKITKDIDVLIALKQNALSISVDVTHGYDATYDQKFDRKNSPILGKGVTIKYDSKQGYATCIESAAHLYKIAEKNNLPLQKYHVKSDSKSGGTIGTIFESISGIRTIDIGIPCFSMHAANEVISVKDLKEQTALLKAFLIEPLSLELFYE